MTPFRDLRHFDISETHLQWQTKLLSNWNPFWIRIQQPSSLLLFVVVVVCCAFFGSVFIIRQKFTNEMGSIAEQTSENYFNTSLKRSSFPFYSFPYFFHRLSPTTVACSTVGDWMILHEKRRKKKRKVQNFLSKMRWNFRISFEFVSYFVEHGKCVQNLRLKMNKSQSNAIKAHPLFSFFRLRHSKNFRLKWNYFFLLGPNALNKWNGWCSARKITDALSCSIACRMDDKMHQMQFQFDVRTTTRKKTRKHKHLGNFYCMTNDEWTHVTWIPCILYLMPNNNQHWIALNGVFHPLYTWNKMIKSKNSTI